MKRLLAFFLLLASSTTMAEMTLIGTGTAVVVNKSYVLTAADVLEDCDGATIQYKNKETDVEIIALDSTNGLGLMQLDKPLQHTAKFRGGKPIRLGDTAVNYGHPLFGELSGYAKVSKGVINALAGSGNDSRHFQYDAATQSGNSGGPVLDLSGNVIGIVSSGLRQRYAEETGQIAQNVNFAIKSYVAEGFLSSYGVDYERVKSVRKMELADIAEKAATFTVLVGCWQDASKQAAQTESQPATQETAAEGDCPVGMVQTYKGCEDEAAAAATTKDRTLTQADLAAAAAAAGAAANAAAAAAGAAANAAEAAGAEAAAAEAAAEAAAAQAAADAAAAAAAAADAADAEAAAQAAAEAQAVADAAAAEAAAAEEAAAAAEAAAEAAAAAAEAAAQAAAEEAAAEAHQVCVSAQLMLADVWLQFKEISACADECFAHCQAIGHDAGFPHAGARCVACNANELETVWQDRYWESKAKAQNFLAEFLAAGGETCANFMDTGCNTACP